MLRAFWTWDPVASGTYNTFDEPFAYANNKWFFDKSVWQKMFRTMNGCGFNAIILANTHPFPFMIDVSDYQGAKVIEDAALAGYQQMHHWVFETALDYEIAPYVLFFPGYYPDTLLQANGIDPGKGTLPDGLGMEYMHHCVRRLLETYPELSGLIADAHRIELLQQGVVDALDAARPDAALYLRSGDGDPDKLMDSVKRRAGRQVHYLVKYTGDHLVDSNPDPSFTKWIDTAGAPNIAADFRVCNFEPWTSLSFDTTEGIVQNLEDVECDGFALQPLSLYDWPKASDTFFKFQWQRDLVWYSIWGGASLEELLHEAQPKWLLRNKRVIEGFSAGSRILELLSLYIAGDKQDRWRPQFCSIRDDEGGLGRLLSIEDMLHLEDMPASDWWQEVTCDQVVHISQYIQSGTPENAYGPEELIEELADLAEQSITAGEKGMRNNSGERELPGLSRDALCMGWLGEFYIERFKAALAHARGDNTEALDHMARALGKYQEIADLDSSHRTEFRVVTDRSVIVGDWSATVSALQAEYDDAVNGEFRSGYKI
ncbi:hypothetical protein LLG39_01900 [bacterium]|nr:hypothetical protein [bacterium]